MRATRTHVLCLVTAPDLGTARKLAKAALESRLAACASLVPGIESHYWWKGRLERAGEILLLMKTTRTRLKALEAVLLRNHPYDTPEILSLPIGAGTPRYLDWLDASVTAPPPPRRKSR
jgi:periplasmic divalent cation tolerance protein